MPSALYTDVYLKGKGRLAEGRAGRCQHELAASSPCRRGDARFRSRAGFHSRSGVAPCLQSLACGEVSPAGSGSREAQRAELLGHGLPEGSGRGHLPPAEPQVRQVPGSLCDAAASPAAAGSPPPLPKLLVNAGN